MEVITGCFLIKKETDNTKDVLIDYKLIKDSSCEFKLNYLERQIEILDMQKDEYLSDVKTLNNRNEKLRNIIKESKSEYIKGKKIKHNTIVINKVDCDSVNNLLIKDNVNWTERYKVKGINNKDKSKVKTDNSVKTKETNNFWTGFIFGVGAIIILYLIFIYIKSAKK